MIVRSILDFLNQNIKANSQRHFLLGMLLVSLFFSSCSRKMLLADMGAVQYEITPGIDSIHNPDNLEKTIGPHRDSMKKAMGSVIGYVAVEMPRAQPESSLTHWMADVVFEAGEKYSGRKVDFSLLNYGGIRVAYVAAGPITIGNVFEIMPFDNFLTILTVSGKDIQKIFDLIAFKNGGWPVSEGVYVELKGKKATLIEINGVMLDPKASYVMATTSFLAEGGDGLDMLKTLPRVDYPVFIRDLLISDIKHKNARSEKIGASSSGRMIKVE